MNYLLIYLSLFIVKHENQTNLQTNDAAALLHLLRGKLPLLFLGILHPDVIFGIDTLGLSLRGRKY